MQILITAAKRVSWERNASSFPAYWALDEANLGGNKSKNLPVYTFIQKQPSGSQRVVPETPVSASFGIVRNPDYHPRPTDLETEGRED